MQVERKLFARVAAHVYPPFPFSSPPCPFCKSAAGQRVLTGHFIRVRLGPKVMSEKCDIGLVGLAVMGQNLVLNMESKGFTVAVFNRTTETTDKFLAENAGRKLVGAKTLEEFVEALARPRRIMIMVKAGAPVDAVIDSLTPLLAPGDLIIDGGNSLFTDTERRVKDLSTKGFRFLGAGVSGGEEGALKGPSIMPGGNRDAYELVEPIFTKIAAQVDGEACCRYMGPGGAGHFVKMVHNGIEYGDMQLICEAYAMLRDLVGLEAEGLAALFEEWNRGELNSYLIHITARIFKVKDLDSGLPLVDRILDKAGQKGTGKWTLQAALDYAVPASTINAAVEARVISSMKEQRVAASKALHGPTPKLRPDLADQLKNAIRDALYASKIISYTQGMALMGAGSIEHHWNLNFGDIATIWRGGCIIRAQFLHRIKEAYDSDASLQSLMLAPFFRDVLNRTEANWRFAVARAVEAGIPVPAFTASLGYYDSYRSERLPANLLQAQRDFFGAHTYERTDRPGSFHTEWGSVDD